MDKKRLIFGVSISMVLISIWLLVMNRIDHAHPDWAKSAQEAPATEPTTGPIVPEPPIAGRPGAGAGLPGSGPAAGLTTGPATGPSIGPVAGLHAVAGPANTPLATLGSTFDRDPNYALALELDPRGASIASVTLNDFRQTVRSPARYVFQTPYADLPGTEPMASSLLTVNGKTVDVSGPWELVTHGSNAAEFRIVLADGEKPILRVVKKYQVTTRNEPGLGHDVVVEVSFENLSTQPLKIQQSFTGPTIPPKEVERGADRQLILGYQDAGNQIKVSQHLVEEYKDRTAHDLSKLESQPAVWAGASSVYFSAIVLPGYPAAGAAPATYAINAQNLSSNAAEDHEIGLSFESSAIDLAPGATAKLPATLFLGPKQRQLLETPIYASYPREFSKVLVIASGYCGFCTFSWLILILVKMLSAFHFVLLRDWGLAIIALVVLVRVALHPITKRSQVQMMKMGKMGPEIERLKSKYADDKDALNKAMVGVYKEQGMAPILGCLPMFLQMPIWIALWSALQSTFELRQSPFLWFGPVHLTWIRDLANPDALISWTAFKVPMVGAVGSLNVLPLLMAVVFFLQQKYTPKPPAASPEQEQQQKMMTWMSTLLFPLFLYNGPAGLNLYILTSTTIGIIESKVVRAHIKQREEAERAGRVIVDARPTRAARQRSDIGEPRPEKPAGFFGWLAELQAKADQLKNDNKKDKR